jgi:hypothetical protein
MNLKRSSFENPPIKLYHILINLSIFYFTKHRLIVLAQSTLLEIIMCYMLFFLVLQQVLPLTSIILHISPIMTLVKVVWQHFHT